jgi:hypothetical protein
MRVAMGRYDYDELVAYHETMTKRLSGLAAYGIVEFRVNRLRGVIEVVVKVDRRAGPQDPQHLQDLQDVQDLVVSVPVDAYEVIQVG